MILFVLTTVKLLTLHLKFRSNLLKAFRVDLKTFLGLVLPHQYCLIVVRENRGWFLGDIISWATPTPLWSLLYSYYRTVCSVVLVQQIHFSLVLVLVPIVHYSFS